MPERGQLAKPNEKLVASRAIIGFDAIYTMNGARQQLLQCPRNMQSQEANVQRGTNLSGDDDGVVEGLLVAVYPLDVFPQAFAVVKHLPCLPCALITVTFLAAAAAVVTAASCSAPICFG